MGRSEARIGQVVRELGGWPKGRILSTKLDRDMDDRRFDGPRARRSLEESLAGARRRPRADPASARSRTRRRPFRSDAQGAARSANWCA